MATLSLSRPAKPKLSKNNITVIILINKILPYSAINRNAKLDPPYSILNPETNSLSPSAKSKGARLVSAIIQIIHKPNKAGRRARTQNTGLAANLNLSNNNTILSKVRAITTS